MFLFGVPRTLDRLTDGYLSSTPMRDVLAFINRVAPFLLSESQRASFRREALNRTMIASATDGELVRIVGHVRRHRSVLYGPITDTPCVFYRAEVYVDVFENPDNEKGRQGPLVRAEGCRDFVVEDETGRGVVTSRGAQIDFPAGWQEGFDDRIIRFLETCRRSDMVERLTSMTSLLGWRQTVVRYHEAMLIDGTPVSVSGRARWMANATDPATATTFVTARSSRGPSSPVSAG